MAGIGWRLERMLERDTLASTAQAYLVGVAVTCAPWLLTTAVLVTLRTLSRGAGLADFGQVELRITLSYAATLVLSAPIHVVVSRYVADRLYEKRLELVARPLAATLVATMFGFLAVGAVVSTAISPSLTLGVSTALLTAIVAAQWLLLAVGGGMSSPAGVLRAFVGGAGTSVLAAIGLERAAGLGAHGYLLGFTGGQAVALAWMLVRIFRDLPATSPEPVALRAAFVKYRLLAASAFLVQLAIWIDKLCTWLVRGTVEASHLATAGALAWFVVIPAFTWIYLQIETSFYRAFRRYYGRIEKGAALADLQAAAAAVRAETVRLVRGAVTIQLVALVLAGFAAPLVVDALGLPPGTTLAVRLSLAAASLQVLTLLGLLLLYYLDLQHEALAVAGVQLGMLTLSTTLILLLGLPPALGATLGSFVPAIVSLSLVVRAVGNLVPDTFQSQPFGR
ncbi:MAG: exopolysaccharide Pel transporter PelG [Deltaproteobacteria bacterium]|nr:exopolysaccharide Pel transporter PelG [Deltaproteobacteria bacterium]